jgi:DNA polymerase-3 subunit gamma/tau
VSYLAIARKYRPATFADIVGQEHVVRTLENAIASGRIHHAYLFCGARGVGKTTAARALAKALNCAQGPTATPCGVCTSCIEIATGNSSDLIEIDGASNNSVDDVRELRDTVSYAPTRGGFKVYLVDEVHMLSKAAFNALLKTLEEPPPKVVFIFATTEPNRILDTILSRVQRFDFKRIPVQAVADRLGTIGAAEGVTLSAQGLRMVARAGEGSMRDAQSLLDKVISFSGGNGVVPDSVVAETLGLIDRSLLFGFLEGLVKGDPATCLESIATVYEYGYELSEFTSDLLELLRNATFVRLSPSTRKHVDASADEIARLEALVADVPAEALTRTFNALLDVHDQVSRATRPRIVLEMAVARLATTRPVEPLGTLLARLEDLERRARVAAPAGSARPTPRPSRSSPREVRVPVVDREPPRPDPVATDAIAPIASAAVTMSPSRAPRAQNRAPTAQTAQTAQTAPIEPVEPARPVAPTPEPTRTTPKQAPQQASAPQPSALEAQAPRPEPPAWTPAMPVRRAARPSREEEPPPNDDPEGFGAPAPDPSERWKRLVPELRKLGPAAIRLAEGRPSVRGTVLVITLPAGRALAEGRRARATPEVEGVIRRQFPKVSTIQVEPLAGTGTALDHQRALAAQILEDPDLRRIMARLGAEIESVTEITPPTIAESSTEEA